VVSYLSKSLFFLGIFGIVGVLILAGFGVDKHADALMGWLLTFGPALIVIAAILEFYMERRGFEVDAARYEQAHRIFLNDSILWPDGHGLHFKPIRSLDVLSGIGVGLLVFLRLVERDANVWFVLLGLFTALLVVLHVVLQLLAFEESKRAVRAYDLGESKSKWSTELQTADGERWERIRKEAVAELIDWYCTSYDRVVSVPKG
jgi:hypothetical protein